MVVISSSHRARVESVTKIGLKVFDENDDRVLQLRPDEIEREQPEPFASLTSLYDIPVLQHLPCALLLNLDNQWHFCCHGRFDERLITCGWVPLSEKIDQSVNFLYETSDDYTTNISEASIDNQSYSLHVTKWGDIAENTLNTVAVARARRTGRVVMTVAEMDRVANSIGLAEKYALVSGHQDMVNCAYGHRHGTDRDITSDWVASTSGDPTRIYFDMLTVLRLAENVANPFPLEYQRFIVTSSAYYSKRDVTEFLKHTCWLTLAQGRMLLHHATPKALDGTFGEADNLDDATFWQIIDHAVNVVKYPNEAGKTPLRGNWSRTRFFSQNYVSSVLHATREVLQKHVPAHSVTYQVLRAEDALVVFIGDLHSSIRSLGIIIEWCRQIGCFELDDNDNPTARLRPNVFIVFLGDLIDRGPFGVEILVIASLLKLATPAQVVILNGNHEDAEQYNVYGMQSELNGEYPDIVASSRDARTVAPS